MILALVAVLVGTVAVEMVGAQQQPAPARQARARRGEVNGFGGGVLPLAMIRRGLAQLDLSQEQKAQIRGIIEQHRQEFQALSQRAVPGRRALADAVSSGDEGIIRQRVSELSAVQLDEALLAAKVRADVFKVLTPEQREKAAALRTKAEARVDRMRQRRADRK